MKKGKVIICIMGFTLALTGCSIPFEKLLANKDGTTQVNTEGEVPKIVSINLNSTDTEDDNIEQFIKVSKSLETKLKNKDLYVKCITSSNKQNFYSEKNDVFSGDYIADINNGEKEEVIMKLLAEIYKSSNRKIYSTTLVSIGKEVINDKDTYKLIVDVNTVDDDPGFHIQRLNLLLDKNKMIIDIIKVGNLKDEDNTTNPITKDSEISTSIHNEFLGELKSLLSSMSNKVLYENLTREGKNGESSKFKSFISKIDLKDKDISSLYNMFKFSKGEFKNYTITSYQHNDIDSDPITTYVVTIPYEGGVSSFDVDFNRISNKIIGIKEVK